MRKILFILAVGALFTLSGCSKEKSTVNNEITVYLYDTKMLNDLYVKNDTLRVYEL